MPGNLELPPPEVIAAWPAPNHVNPERRAWMPAFSGTLQAVTTLLVVTRLILRAQRRAGGLGIDDAMLFLGFLAGTMFTCVAILGAGQYGFDRHIYDIDFTKVTETALIAWLSQLTFLVSTSATKVSVLLAYRRVSAGSLSRYWKWGTVSAIGFTVAYCIAFVGVLIGGCRPVNAYWRAYDPVYAASVEYTCIPTKFLNPLSGGLSVVSDFYAVVLPIGLLWHLKISKRQRYALNAVFSLGFVVVIVGIVRTVSLQKLGHTWDLT
ncbi:unnamed protein product [Zymoseptoria tritici ST99CH_3D7]|uniref:Rhodopsin domain-containing protein n=2 Tax=Zymoseptoria tritici TaxID=1047171 RepID=A0A1X7RTY0_ZYMT9|nr:unnamed protein product [Zymoseptoria tritici ST99CH_3D7]SMR52619.1 unnamed protein product [Zymoseptoria tritici ST99CH_1E4]